MPVAAGWAEVRTAHVVVTTDAGAERGIELARAVDEIVAAFAATMPDVPRERAPLPVLALARSRDFFRLLPEYRERRGGGAVAAAIFAGPGSEDVVLRLDAEGVSKSSVIYHETVHSLTRRELPGLPVWLEEGLAELWSTAVIDGGVLRLGGEHGPHREHLREEGLLPLAKLVGAAERAPGAPVPGSSFYASSWALTHYLVVGGGGAPAAALPVIWSRLMAYVERCRSMGDPRAAFEETFGPLSAMKGALDAYLEAARLPDVTLRFASSSPEWQLRSLREPEIEAALGAFLVRRGALEAARPYLEAAIAAEPELPLAVEAMGHLAFAAGDDALAMTLLGRALESGADELVARHLLVATLRREGSLHRDPAAAGAVIRRLVAMQPELAPAWIELAQTYAGSGVAWRLVVEACRSAVESRPDSAWFRLLLARAYMVGGEVAQADREGKTAVELVTAGDDATLANNVCWYGGVGGMGASVLPACEHAVGLAPGRGLYRDSRGLVRALHGDLDGAAEDLRFFLDSSDAADPALRSQREEWLRSLAAGISPFTPERLEQLSDLPF